MAVSGPNWSLFAGTGETPVLRSFFGTRPQPCPYLPGRTEVKAVTELAGQDAARLHDVLSFAGFRRSHDVVYKPACPGCDACIATRIPVARLNMTRTLRRVQKRNADLAVAEVPCTATVEQYRLFQAYQHARHRGGGMAGMDFTDYRSLIEISPVETRLLEYRDAERRLLGACLVDVLGDGLSAVYSFFAPDAARRSLGSYMILSMIARARVESLAHVYLGYWVEGSRKMSYKTRFTPLEGLGSDGWSEI